MAKDASKVEAPGKPAGEGASKPGRKKGGQLTHGAIVAQTVAQGGKCWVTGESLGASVAMVDGKLVSGQVGELARGGDLETLKGKLLKRLLEGAAFTKTYGPLLDQKRGIVFAGEKAIDKAGEKPATSTDGKTAEPLAASPAG